MKAVDELVQFESNLSKEDQETISKDFNDLIRDSPKTQVAARRTKTIIAKASDETKSGFRELTVDILRGLFQYIL